MSSTIAPPDAATYGPAQAEGARRGLVGAIRTLFGSRVMSHSGHGNISVRIGTSDRILYTKGELLVPPSTGDTSLRPRVVSDEHVVYSLDGELIEGTPNPLTGLVIRMHTEIYRLRPDVGAVIHTHSPAATSYALAATPLPARYEALLVHGQAVDIPVAPWGPRGSDQAVQGIVRTFAEHPLTQAVLLANHGLLVAGDDAAHAARLVVAIEEAAVSTLGAAPLGGARELPPEARDEPRLRF